MYQLIFFPTFVSILAKTLCRKLKKNSKIYIKVKKYLLQT